MRKENPQSRAVSFRRRRCINSPLMFLFSLVEDRFSLNEASAIDDYMNRFQLFTNVHFILVYT